MKGMKIDSYALARMVGVSQATVSRAFTRPEKVSATTRKKIMEAARTLGYTPDRHASALRRKGTSTIVLLHIHRGDQKYWTNIRRNQWIFAEAVLSLTGFFENLPYHLEIRNVDSVFSVNPLLMKEHCDGVIVFDFVSEEEARAITTWEIPYVFCHRASHLDSFNHSATDNLAGGRLQASYLIKQGSINPAYIMNDEDPFSHPLRLRGFTESFPSVAIINEDDRTQRTSRGIQSIRSNAIDGLAFVNDALLVQTLTDIAADGIQEQQTFPVIGYDNSTVLLVLEQVPASIEIGIAKIYRDAAAALIELIEGEQRDVSLVHEPELVLSGQDNFRLENAKHLDR